MVEEIRRLAAQYRLSADEKLIGRIDEIAGEILDL